MRTEVLRRAIADAVAEIGTHAAIGDLTHELRCGLVFQSARIAKRRAIYNLHAFSSALNGTIDKGWFEASARSDEEAELQYQMAQFQREAAR
jgi:hypothetical protein